VARERETPDLLKGPDNTRVIYLLDASTSYEAKLLENWIRSEIGSSAIATRITSSRRAKDGNDVKLNNYIQSLENTFLIPLRVVWMAPEKSGRRSVSWADIYKPGDPRDPKGLRARWIRMMRPQRVRLIAAQGAYVSDLAHDHGTSGQVDPLTSFVTRRAWRVLDQAERKLRGNRYKIPRFVPEAILSRQEFVEAVEDVASRTQADPVVALQKSDRYLREIAATHSPYVIDIIANGIHKLYRQGYGEIHYSEEQVRKVAELGHSHPLVFLPSHRSNLDRLSLQFMLWENDLPPNHTAGGINLNFFPIGPLLRRTGVFFIRRSFRDNEIYKTVLKAYLDFLVEKRFPLEWYMEGGRSRSGRLMKPRFGLLHYVVDAYKRGKADDIQLIPVSIAYDQIQDVPDYAREAQGKSKEKESIGWLVKAVRSLRRRYGDIYIRIGEPVSMSSVIEGIEGDEEDSIGLQKLAFEVMYRIGRVTPVTPTALVCVALLAERGEARTADELAVQCGRLYRFVHDRGIPTTEDFDLSSTEAVLSVLSELADHGNVSSHEALGRTVYWLDEDQMIRVSYYRNMIVHFFVPRSLAEMAITSFVDTAESTADDIRRSLLELRDLFKFEFFFQEKERFLDNAGTDIAIDIPNWDEFLESSGPTDLLSRMGDAVAFWALLPILDGYQIVGDELEALKGDFNEKAFLKACLARARMYRIEGRLISGESASQVMFKSALALARNRNLLEETPDIEFRRKIFAQEVRAARGLAAAGL
jgi:glycerol-3-phosphate O-acyltransferase